ncbi:uncharacterized protein (TIGR03084 family) [Paractinoplanes brasiliensis]|uniref:Uncharacterized protein (TIGR03084 family) n=1 Tax=Paractinoplanes brasiliensis TaxID=52695 RepID=A0A4R6K031_9ACTN|nr:uncharacterized protein (TIGR03084 family) [Actinoplanes brasiliensis]GID33067.1 wyosine base formation [Actinoplanes brasiliensis]
MAAEILTDVGALRDEAAELDALVAELRADQWRLETPAVGWTIAHQIVHLAAAFRMAGVALTRPEEFTRLTAGLSARFGMAVATLQEEFLASGESPLERWRAEREVTEGALAASPAAGIVPWPVRPVPASVLVAVGLTEVFAHGQDVRDALGVRRRWTDRIRQVAGFGARTRDFGYLARGLTPPAEEFRFELTGPSGDLWEFGPAGSDQVVSGPAADFCLLVTRRRHRDDLALVARGAEADRWLGIAQAYRGPAGPGRQSGQFSSVGG